jgi:hypothetical protein
MHASSTSTLPKARIPPSHLFSYAIWGLVRRALVPPSLVVCVDSSGVRFSSPLCLCVCVCMWLSVNSFMEVIRGSRKQERY